MRTWPVCERSRTTILVIAFIGSVVAVGILGNPAGAATLATYSYDCPSGSRAEAVAACVVRADNPAIWEATINDNAGRLSGRCLCPATSRFATKARLPPLR